MGTVRLKPGRDKPVLNRHPWVFSGAISRIEEDAEDGDVVAVRDAAGTFLAWGYLNRKSQITVRLLSWEEGDVIDQDFWRRRLARAIAARRDLIDERVTDACRLVNAESDLLPGLIVDRYADFLVVQFLTLGMDCRKQEIVTLLEELLSPSGIFERSDVVDVREKEGLPARESLLLGKEPPPLVEARENGYHFLVDVRHGHKTGFYLDQRENRRRVAGYCTGREVLNAFSYTGAFAVYAAGAGAGPVTNVDTSVEVLELARRNMELNGFGEHEVEYSEEDVFTFVRRCRDERRAFDVVILDPPKFAHSRSQVESACRGYKDINLMAMRLLRPGGVLVTFSCSAAVSAELFQKVVFGASLDAGRDVRIIEWLAQGSDHPVLLSFPEAAYLKGLICQVW